MENTKISVHGLDLYYGDNHALKNVNIEIKEKASARSFPNNSLLMIFQRIWILMFIILQACFTVIFPMI